jgi:phytoene/squalene synthetase
MQSAAQYRAYAQECRRLAKTLKPESRETLLKIADAWDKCADEIESARSFSDGVDKGAER